MRACVRAALLIISLEHQLHEGPSEWFSSLPWHFEVVLTWRFVFKSMWWRWLAQTIWWCNYLDVKSRLKPESSQSNLNKMLLYFSLEKSASLYNCILCGCFRIALWMLFCLEGIFSLWMKPWGTFKPFGNEDVPVVMKNDTLIPPPLPSPHTPCHSSPFFSRLPLHPP